MNSLSAKFNTHIKVFHNETVLSCEYRENANTVAKALVHLDRPWFIEMVDAHTFVAHCSTSPEDAIVVPQLKAIDCIRYQRQTRLLGINRPMIMSA